MKRAAGLLIFFKLGSQWMEGLPPPFLSRRGLVPVVEDRDTFDFTAVSIPKLGGLNAIGWQPDDGRTLLATVRGHLGREIFPRQGKPTG